MGKAGGTTKDGPPSGGRSKVAPAPRANGVRSISDLVGRVGGASFRRFGFVQHAIVSRWGEIVGPRYAEVTAPESIRFPTGLKSRGVLNLTVEGAHAPMLQHVLPTIIERVNRFFGYPAIERVTLRQGRVTVRKEPAPRPVQSIALTPEMGDSLREIGDPELHAVLESLARSLTSGEGTDRIAAIPVVGRIGERRR